MNLVEVAKKVEIGLLEKLSSGDILDYAIDVIHDDKCINVVMAVNRPIKEIRFTLGAIINSSRDKSND